MRQYLSAAFRLQKVRRRLSGCLTPSRRQMYYTAPDMSFIAVKFISLTRLLYQPKDEAQRIVSA